MDAQFLSEEGRKWVLQNILKLLVEYNRFKIKLRIKTRCARKQNAHLNMLCELWENLYTIIAAFFAYITYNKIDPSQPAWISVCKYINGLFASTNDIYMEFPAENLKVWASNSEIVLDPEHPYREIFYNKYAGAKVISYSNEFSNVANDLVIAQICPDTTIVRIVKNVDPEKDLSVLESSSARFLEIEYKCGDLPGVAIEVPKSHYLAGNEVLSKAYVLRYLEHMSIFVNWVFKESDYSLRIVDEDSAVFSLNSNQYIKLLNDGYKIVESIVDDNVPEKPQLITQCDEEETKDCFLEEKEKIE